MLPKVRFGEIGDGCNSRANAEKIAAAPPNHCRPSREIVSKFTDAPKCATLFHSHLSRQICYLLCRGGGRRRGGPVVVPAAGRHRLVVVVAHAGVHGGTAASATSLALPGAILLGFLFPNKGISFCSHYCTNLGERGICRRDGILSLCQTRHSCPRLSAFQFAVLFSYVLLDRNTCISNFQSLLLS